MEEQERYNSLSSSPKRAGEETGGNEEEHACGSLRLPMRCVSIQNTFCRGHILSMP
jgi:hypothetical protein